MNTDKLGLENPIWKSMPGQRLSPGEHLREWGCKIHTLMSFIQHKKNKAFTPQEIRAFTVDAWKAGHILDNDIPIDPEERKEWEKENGKPCPEWYRVYVTKEGGPGLVKMVSGFTLVRFKETSVIKDIDEEYDYIEIQWKTKSGFHYGTGYFNQEGKLVTLFDPWPGLNRIGVASLRFYTLR